MSSYLAIGGVSATLQALLEERMLLPTDVTPAQFEVTVGIPFSGDADAAEAARVNLYLYSVTRNGALANQDIPGRSDPGAADQPPLPLNLHYLVSAYGNTDDNGGLRDQTRSHYLLGSAMQVLHETPIVTDTMRSAGGTLLLHRSLRGEYERVKLTLDPLSIEDATKIWTALTQPYRVSVAYEVSVVQIEPSRRRRPSQRVAPPPAGPQVVARPASLATIDEVSARTPGAPARRSAHARIGDVLTLHGRGFDPEGLRVRIGGVDATGEISAVAPDRITVAIPDDPALRPGAMAVQVVTYAEFGTPPQPRAVAASNAAAFTLVPQVDAVAAPAVPIGPWVVTGRRLFDAAADCLVLVGDTPLRDTDYTARTERRLDFRMPSGVPAGHDLTLRVRVNAAEDIDRRVVRL